MTHSLLLAAQTVSGGISIFGWTLAAPIIVAFLVGCFVGHKWL